MADVRVQEAGSIRVSVGDRIEDLDTPLILADLDQMERNIADWQSWMDARGVKFRGEPAKMGPITAVLFEDTCGNLINLVQPGA